MLRLLGEDDNPAEISASIINILINLAEDKAFIQELIGINVARRIFDFLMRNV